jgi:rare lipoprotein A
MILNNRAVKLAFATLCCFWIFFDFVSLSHGTQYGKASWYAMTSLTANGERASPDTMTVAHRSLRFGTRIRVTNLRNSQSVVLCVNDRGPFIKNRIVDVTKAAARKLGFVQSGWTDVRVDIVDRKSNRCN